MTDLRFVPRALRRLDETSAEVIACGVYRDERPMRGLAGLVDWRLAGRLSRLAKEGFLVGEVGELLAIPVRPRLPFDKLLVAGLGPRGTFGESAFRAALERINGALAGLQVTTAILELPGRADEAISAERAATLAFDVIGGDSAGTLTFVEDAGGQAQMVRHVSDRRRAALRAHG